MEAIMALVLLIALGGASLRWRYDSRESIHSKEQELAAYGVSWRDLRNPPDATEASPNGNARCEHWRHWAVSNRSFPSGHQDDRGS